MRTHVISPRLWCVLFLGMVLSLSACGQANSSSASTATPGVTPTPTVAVDMYGTPISFPKTAPQRIISLAPSVSEILGALQLQKRVVGVDALTNYPASMASLKKISDKSGNISIESIVALKPDLVLTTGGLSKKYNTQLMQLGLNVIDLPSPNVSQTLDQILLVGRLTYTEDTAQALVKQMQQQLTQIEQSVKGTAPSKVLLEIDDSTPGKPYVFGGGSFGDEMLQYANGTNIFHANSTNGGYPQVSDEAIIAANPQYVVLTEDPLYGGQPSVVYKRANWGGIAAVKSHQVYHINSDITQRPGPRIVEGIRCLAQVIHPDKFIGALPDYCSASV
ncbi:ABC transporter substrate-binding protein [Dictyobacter arantiisoli]|nr:ABC transporter substrate-binding protein [Dictyobacter arantiisoli]